MNTIELTNVSKYYVVNKNEKFYALKDVNISFNDGFNSIIGKSGSGKSTLLNIIGKIDSPSSGDVRILGKKINCNTFKYDFYKSYVSIVFQNYNLINEMSVQDNVIMPLLIKGIDKNKAYDVAKKQLKFCGIEEPLFKQPVKLLSGGEKQRVAIARSLAVDPKVLLCDEPTGALDENNSFAIMDLLKKISINKCVIVVSHNLQIVKQYSDRIIEIKDGVIIKDIGKNKSSKIKEDRITAKKKNGFWIDKIFKHNFKKRLTRNLLSSIGLFVGCFFLLLTLGIKNGKDTTIYNETFKQFDYGVATVSYDQSISTDSLITLTKSTRPDISVLLNHKTIPDLFEICLNYDAIFNQFSKISINEVFLEDVSFTPIYSFQESYYNKELLETHNAINENEIVINNECYNYLKKKLGYDPINNEIIISLNLNYKYYDFDGTVIEDYVEENVELTIKGLCNELDYLKTPKMYYSISYFDQIFDSLVLQNLSTYFNSFYSIKDLITNVDDTAALSSYSYRIFPKNIKAYKDIKSFELENKDFSYTSQSIIIQNSLLSFVEATSYALDLFLILIFIGVAFILGMISFSNYSDDRKQSAILTCFGARNTDLYVCYFIESFICGLFGLLMAIISVISSNSLLNRFVYQYIGVNQAINIPIKSFFGLPYFLPILLLAIIILICLFTSIFPILISKRISLKEELKSL